MSAAKPILAIALAIGVGYVAYPYATLYRLNQAIDTGNANALRTLVDWPAVREGIKEDLCDNVAASPATTVSDGELPAFGASFVRGIATNEVDRNVTPKGVVELTHRQFAANAAGSGIAVNWAFFDDPTNFVVSFNATGQHAPIRLQLTLKDAAWQVTRIWLPTDMLRAANART